MLSRKSVLAFRCVKPPIKQYLQEMSKSVCSNHQRPIKGTQRPPRPILHGAFVDEEAELLDELDDELAMVVRVEAVLLLVAEAVTVM
jgi:hypothetical protein